MGAGGIVMHKTAEVIPLGNAMSQQKWIDRITAAWREQLPSIFETGNLLEASKLELAHGLYMEMIREKLPFGQSTANKLVAISCNDNLRDTNSEPVPNLPVHWGILYELTLLTAEQFAEGIKTRAINPKMQRKDVKVLRGIEPKKKDKQTIPPLPKSLSRCLAHVRRTIWESWQEIPPEEKSCLFAELRAELDDLERKINENNAARQSS